MRRRRFVKTIAIAGLASMGWRVAANRTVIRNGLCFIGGKLVPMDVGITTEGRIQIGAPGSLNATEAIDVQGKIVAPGFIDLLSDNTASPQRTFGIVEKYKVTDGVTTALQMHGGSGDASTFYRTFTPLKHRINFGVSTAVMQIRYATQDGAARLRRVEQCLEQGALGVSHSLEYQPTPYAEVIQYARLAKKYDRPFFLHLRYSSEAEELKGVDEAIQLARESEARLHIDHLHSTGGTFHMEEALARIFAARKSGLQITCCVYPYSYWATYLHSRRFDEGWQQRYGLTYNDLRLVGTGERLTRESFAKYRAEKRLVAVPEGTLDMKRTVDMALRESYCLIGSDGGIEREPRANSHPRGAGCFATALAYTSKAGMKMEEMLFKMTEGPREVLGASMKQRGVLADGLAADITVFDPARVNGRATVENPNQFSEGIEYVWVNGDLAVNKGNLLPSFSGRPVQYPKN